jgi:Icc-related predicted phosphoesterase
MNLLAITDLHSNRASLERILSAATPQAILLGGDITHFGTGNEAARIVQRCRELTDTVLAVAGNCDSPEIDRTLARLSAGLFGRSVVIEGTGFYGLSAMPRWHGSMYELTEDQIAAALASGREELAATDAVDRYVLVSHPPPRGTLDVTHRGEHVGSTALAEHLARHSVDLVVCGHIHEARGVAQCGTAVVVNCGSGYEGSFAEIRLADPVAVQLRLA